MSKLPTLRPSLLDYLVEQKRGAARQARTSAFARSGTSVTAEGVTTVDGEHIVDGSETVNGPLAVHGAAAFDGSTTIGGDLVVAGTLSLPNGIVGNDALASVVIPGDCSDFMMGFALTTLPVIIRAQTLTVPAGITSALVTATVQVDATNSTAGLSTLATSIKFGLAAPARQEQAVAGAGQYVTTRSTSTKVLTGLTPGSTFDIAITAQSTVAGWAYSALNGTHTDGYVLWFR